MIIMMLLGTIIGVLIYTKPRSQSNHHYSTVIPTLLLPLTLFFFKVGSFIYGGGLVIIPFIENEVVHKLGWLSQSEFLAGFALGQVTPGPVVITAAFIGYKIAGFLGAFIATLAIFLPSFIFILITAKWLKKLKNIAWIKGALKGVNAAVIGSIFTSIYALIPTAIIDIPTLIIALIGFISLFKYKVNIFYAIAISGSIGLILGII